MSPTRRFSRYHSTSSPPPYLTAILRALAKACRSRPIDKNTVRGTCASANPLYKDKGKSDDVFRFLINVAVLLEEDRTYYFDEERADVVLNCIERGQQPAPAAPTTRLALVKAALAKARTSSPCVIVPIHPRNTEAALVPPEMTSQILVVPVAREPEPAPKPAATPPAIEQPTSLVPQATFHSLPEPTGVIEPQFVIYLTPVEKDVWESAIIQARQIADSKRIGVPNDPEQMKSVWGDSRIDAPPEEYTKALQRFVDADLIRVVGPSGNSRVAYEFAREPELYHVVPIPTREQYEMAPLYLTILRAIQRGDYSTPEHRGLQLHFSEWVSKCWPAVNPKTVYNKMVNFTPGSEYNGYGILFRHGDRYLLSVKGLERFDFVSNNKEVVRHNRVQQEPEGLEIDTKEVEAMNSNQEPAREPDPATSPVNIVAEDASDDVDIEAKIRELEESIAQQQSELVAWKLALQRKQDAEREALKRELAEADRLRQEADKRAADARAKLRKLGIENP